ncbi:radical SAM family heme chaperone HemW [Adlercreutzia sp. ZJ154]|uniref:radical SAM family heme chaperone HemW n=1 Tax=Adlercreutzia sp. ZJ154 TaxID=2709790 RepID=UPI0013EB5E15|nr:radical SAM family heme chaperone HemW [Adlercreutzia sp. ZJ154]
MPHDPYKALYIHIPFCKSRCIYCDFTTKAQDSSSPEITEYFEDLISKIREFSKAGELSSIETVYIGGGTPTHAGNANLTSLLYALGISMHLTPSVECTVEANPESLDERMVDDLWALGVNRLSLGVQSFDDNLLSLIGRAHNSEEAANAIRTAQRKFENISVDLMCGLPGQTLDSFISDARQAIELGVKHISIYPLSVEEHTPLNNMICANMLPEPDEDLQADMMEEASRILRQSGFLHYEVANYAIPGYESRHNCSYWQGIPYLGIGFSATTMTQNASRRMRVQDNHVVDDLNASQMVAEDLMLAMRMAKGVSDDKLNEAALILPQAMQAFQDLAADGFLEHADNRWQPTKRGWLCGNHLYGALLDLSNQ